MRLTVWYAGAYAPAYQTVNLILVTSRQHRQCFIQQTLTQSSAPEDGRNYRPKDVELIEIFNKISTVASSWLFLLLYH